MKRHEVVTKIDFPLFRQLSPVGADSLCGRNTRGLSIHCILLFDASGHPSTEV
ncbi:MAG: hypothetical protein ABA06_00815 [Parcubacteria bacterium C7867-001]|nr:MAG: hypothetical protein ABA06_00815 [Parcubacteria bacterium C7867-001]